MFKVFVDADSIPIREKKIVLTRAIKEDLAVFFVADRDLPDVREAIKNHKDKLRAPFRGVLEKDEIRKIDSTIRMIIVESGENSADDRIVEMIEAGDLLISHDVPLSFRSIEKGAVALDDRGEIYTKENIRERMSQREYMMAFREMGINEEKQRRLKEGDYQKFANSFDFLLNRLK